MNTDYTMRNFALKMRSENKQTILDIGCGTEQYHAKRFEKNDFDVHTNDITGEPTFKGDFITLFEDSTFYKQYDGIWCAHVLEHQLNVHTFLRSIFHCLKDDGILAITVPNRHEQLLGGHLTLWTLGQLDYNLIVAGFDCKHAKHAQYDGNISVIVNKKIAVHGPLIYDNGDIETIKHCFPVEVCQGANIVNVENLF